MSKQLEFCPQCERSGLVTNNYQVRCRECGWSIESPDPRYVEHVDALGWEKVGPTGPIVELIDALPDNFASTLTTTVESLRPDHPAHDAALVSLTAAEFKNRREEFGLSAEWLALRLNVALKTVQRWENGHRSIPRGVVEELDIISTAMGEGMARKWAQHLLETPDAVMVIPRTGTHLGFPAGWYRALVGSTKELLWSEFGAEGLEAAARLRVVFFDEVEDKA